MCVYLFECARDGRTPIPELFLQVYDHFYVVVWDVCHGTFWGEYLQGQVSGRIKMHYRLWWRTKKLKSSRSL